MSFLNHVLLYAKGHYQQNNIVNDLVLIMYHTDYPYVINTSPSRQAREICNKLLKIVQDHEKNINLQQFIIDLYPENCWRIGHEDSYDICHAVIHKCISMIGLWEVFDHKGNAIIEMGDPNPSILPLTRKNMKG